MWQGEVKGAQIAGFVNVAGDSLEGFQGAGFLNVAGARQIKECRPLVLAMWPVGETPIFRARAFLMWPRR